MISANDFPTCTHFWAKINGQIAMVCKTNDGFFICGPWEGKIKEPDFKVVEAINYPEGFAAENLYYK